MARTSLEMIHDYWNALRGSRPQPCRTEFNPGAVPDALGDTFILNLDGSGQFNYRIAGARICTLFGHDMQGLSFLTPFDLPSRQHLSEIIGRVSTTMVTAEVALKGYSPDNHSVDLGLVFLPMASINKREGRLLGAMAPLQQADWIGKRRISRLEVNRGQAQPAPLAPAPFPDMKMGLRLIQGGIVEQKLSE